MPEPVLYADPMNNSPLPKGLLPTTGPTAEQLATINSILKLACSDSKFQDKAYNAIVLVLNGGTFPPG